MRRRTTTLRSRAAPSPSAPRPRRRRTPPRTARGSDAIVTAFAPDDTTGGLEVGQGDSGDDVAGFEDTDGFLEELGDDHVNGGRGDDRLDGGPGDDVVDGQQDFDSCAADSAADVLRNCEDVLAPLPPRPAVRALGAARGAYGRG